MCATNLAHASCSDFGDSSVLSDHGVGGNGFVQFVIKKAEPFGTFGCFNLYQKPEAFPQWEQQKPQRAKPLRFIPVDSNVLACP